MPSMSTRQDQVQDTLAEKSKKKRTGKNKLKNIATTPEKRIRGFSPSPKNDNSKELINQCGNLEKNYTQNHDQLTRSLSPETVTLPVHQINRQNISVDKPLSQVPKEYPEYCFYFEMFSLYLPLSPIGQAYPVECICSEFLSPLLLTYYPPFNGVILAYDSVRLSSEPLLTIHDSHKIDQSKPVYAVACNEYASTYVWVTAKFLLFRPQSGYLLHGQLNVQNESHISLICWNLFNASIERCQLPDDWLWIERNYDTKVSNSLCQSQSTSQSLIPDESNCDTSHQHDVCRTSDYSGYYVNRTTGKPISGYLSFRVIDYECVSDEVGLIRIYGTMRNITQIGNSHPNSIPNPSSSSPSKSSLKPSQATQS